MIEPEVFHSNDETLASNDYQSVNGKYSLEEIKDKALVEFNNLKSEMKKKYPSYINEGIKECLILIFKLVHNI